MNKWITSTIAYTTKQKQSPQTITTASKTTQKLLHKQPFPSLIHKVPSSTFIYSSWMSFSSHYISQNAVQPRPELVTGTGWAGERASGSLTAPLRWIRSSAAGPSSTDQWRIFRESVPRGCLSLLKQQWHLQLTHTQKCVRALANLGARVSPGNPCGVEGRGAWPILTQPRQILIGTASCSTTFSLVSEQTAHTTAQLRRGVSRTHTHSPTLPLSPKKLWRDGRAHGLPV